MSYDSRPDTYEHIGKVRAYLGRAAAKLIERGLVIPHERQVPAGVGALTMTVIEYEVPLVVHLAWCLMCSRPRARRRLTPPGR